MFNKSSNNKVKFQDQQLDDYVLENSVLKSKLQSKIDALSIMSKELDKCSMERDRYKFLVEQLKCKKMSPLKNHENSNVYKFTPTNTIIGGDMLAKTRDHNNMLKLEVEMLRSRLDEATGDIEALRKQLQKKDLILDENSENKKCNGFACTNIEYEQLVQELEKFQKKYQQIQLDYRATLDEKEELVSDRDYYKNKVQRLNQQISYILTNRIKPQNADSEVDPPKPIVDIDALVMENKYLHERITQLQVEKEIIKRTLTKYKTLLDNRGENYPISLKKGINVMTPKQAREFLERNMKPGIKENSAGELNALCYGLFEAMNDKSIALQHQRKTNRILANRITELEKTLESWCNGQKYIPIFPSQMLLDEFFADAGSLKSEDSKDKTSNGSQVNSDSNKEKLSDSDEENKESSSGSSTDLRKDYNGDDDLFDSKTRTMTKTVLPEELQELVKEALAEMKPTNNSPDYENHPEMMTLE